MITEALFTIAQTWKQPRCPSTDEWIRKCGTMEYYSALMRWMNLKTITQSEVSQKEKNKYRILMNIYRIEKDSTEEIICRATMETHT